MAVLFESIEEWLLLSNRPFNYSSYLTEDRSTSTCSEHHLTVDSFFHKTVVFLRCEFPDLCPFNVFFNGGSSIYCSIELVMCIATE